VRLVPISWDLDKLLYCEPIGFHSDPLSATESDHNLTQKLGQGLGGRLPEPCL